VRAKYDDQGLKIRGTTPDQLGTATREQLAKYGKLMKEAGIKAE
jgi:tripartite-type tricarboxylate transporter receptor subunit TctC